MLKYRNKYSAEDVTKRWAELSDLTKPTLHESANQASRSTLLNKLGAADGKTYGIVLESSKYFVKVAETDVDSSQSKDFNYIGGQANALHERFDSYPAAIRRLNIKVASLRESFHMEEEGSDDEEDALLADLAAKEQEKDTEAEEDIDAVDADVDNLDSVMADIPTDLDGEEVAADDENAALGDEVDAADALGLDADVEADEAEDDDSKFDGMGDDDDDDKDSKDPAGQVQELMGEIGVALDGMVDMSEPVLKNILNTMITKCARGLEDASDETIKKLTSRIEKRGKKLDEEGTEDGQMLDEYDHDMELERGITWGKGVDLDKGDCETCMGTGGTAEGWDDETDSPTGGRCHDCNGSGTDGSEEEYQEMDESSDDNDKLSEGGANGRALAAADQNMAAVNRRAAASADHKVVRDERIENAKLKLQSSQGRSKQVLPEGEDESEREYDRNAGEDMDSEPDGMVDGDVSFEQFVNQYADQYPEDDDTTRAQRIIDYLDNCASSVSEFCLNQAFDEFESDMTPEVKGMVLDAAHSHDTLKPFISMLDNTSAQSQELNESYLLKLVKQLVTKEKKSLIKK